MATPFIILDDDNEKSESCEFDDLHITKVGVLREWIDISELKVKIFPEKQKSASQHTNKIPLKEKTKDNPNWADLEVNVEEDESPKKRKSKYYKCDQCEYSTDWKSNLSKHITCRHKSLGEIKWYKCDLCNYKGKTSDYLRIHRSQSHESYVTWFDCEHCGAKFKNKQSLKLHTTSLHTDPNLIKWVHCDECDFKTKFRTRLKTHKELIHVNPEERLWFRCEECDFISKTSKGVKQHKERRHGDLEQVEWLKCEFCYYQTIEPSKMKLHKIRHEKESKLGSESDVSQSELCCQICSFKTFSKKMFREHGVLCSCVYNRT